MRVFVTGASGFIGSAIVRELIDAGHQVLGLARSDAAAASVAAAGADVQRGSLDDLDNLRRGADAADGVIHTAFDHDFVNTSRETAADADRHAIEAIGAVLAGSGRPFVMTSGTAGGTPGHLYTEDDAGDLTSAGAPRVRSEAAALALASRGVRATAVRLAPSVHGKGDHGFVPMLVAIAREKGVSAYVGDGLNRWPAVHRLDAAHLFRLALERGTAGSRFHGAADEGVPVRDIAALIGRRLNLPVVPKSPPEAIAHFGWLGHFLALDNPTSSALTRERLGWNPVEPGLLADMNEHYFTPQPTTALS